MFSGIRKEPLKTTPSPIILLIQHSLPHCALQHITLPCYNRPHLTTPSYDVYVVRTNILTNLNSSLMNAKVLWFRVVVTAY